MGLKSTLSQLCFTDFYFHYQSFSFLLDYLVEQTLVWTIYFPTVATVIFSGVLGCNGLLPVLGGRPRDVRRMEENEFLRMKAWTKRTSQWQRIRSAQCVLPCTGVFPSLLKANIAFRGKMPLAFREISLETQCKATSKNEHLSTNGGTGDGLHLCCSAWDVMRGLNLNSHVPSSTAQSFILSNNGNAFVVLEIHWYWRFLL